MSCESPSPVPSPSLKVNLSPRMSHGVSAAPWKPERSASSIKAVRLPQGEDGQPEIIPEQAEIVRWLYERYLTGASLRMIKDELEQQGVKCFEDSPEWTISRIRSILQNENTAVMC